SRQPSAAWRRGGGSRMRHRLLVLGAVLAASAAAIGVACTFPDVTFDTSDGGASSGVQPGIDGSSSGSSEGGGSSGASSGGIDAASIDHDSGTVIIGDNCIGGPCDCDNDGWGDYACVDAGKVVYDAGLLHWDCDDKLGGRHPDAGYHDTAMPPRDAGGLQDDW